MLRQDDSADVTLRPDEILTNTSTTMDKSKLKKKGPKRPSNKGKLPKVEKIVATTSSGSVIRQPSAMAVKATTMKQTSNKFRTNGTFVIADIRSNTLNNISGKILFDHDIGSTLFTDSRIAPMFDIFEFWKGIVRFRWRPATVPLAGLLITAIDKDPDDILTIDHVNRALAQFQINKVFSPWGDTPSVEIKANKKLYCNRNIQNVSSIASNELRWSSMGHYYLAVELDVPEDTVLGSIIVDYDLEFTSPTAEGGHTANAYLVSKAVIMSDNTEWLHTWFDSKSNGDVNYYGDNEILTILAPQLPGPNISFRLLPGSYILRMGVLYTSAVASDLLPVTGGNGGTIEAVAAATRAGLMQVYKYTIQAVAANNSFAINAQAFIGTAQNSERHFLEIIRVGPTPAPEQLDSKLAEVQTSLFKLQQEMGLMKDMQKPTKVIEDDRVETRDDARGRGPQVLMNGSNSFRR